MMFAAAADDGIPPIVEEEPPPPPPKPEVKHVNPQNGEGGDSCRIDGTLGVIAMVEFGAGLHAEILEEDRDWCRVTVPHGGFGIVDVIVTCSLGQATMYGGFRYNNG